MSELLEERGGTRLSEREPQLVRKILLEGPVAQQLKQTQGSEAVEQYALLVLKKEQQIVETAQRRSLDQGMEL